MSSPCDALSHTVAKAVVAHPTYMGISGSRGREEPSPGVPTSYPLGCPGFSAALPDRCCSEMPRLTVRPLLIAHETRPVDGGAGPVWAPSGSGISCKVRHGCAGLGWALHLPGLQAMSGNAWPWEPWLELAHHAFPCLLLVQVDHKAFGGAIDSSLDGGSCRVTLQSDGHGVRGGVEIGVMFGQAAYPHQASAFSSVEQGWYCQLQSCELSLLVRRKQF